MIGVIEILVAIEPSLGVTCRNGIRLELSNDAGQISSKRDGCFQLAIRVAQEDRFLDPQNCIRRKLFLLTKISEFLFVATILGDIVRTRVTARDDYGHDFTA